MIVNDVEMMCIGLREHLDHRFEQLVLDHLLIVRAQAFSHATVPSAGKKQPHVFVQYLVEQLARGVLRIGNRVRQLAIDSRILKQNFTHAMHVIGVPGDHRETPQTKEQVVIALVLLVLDSTAGAASRYIHGFRHELGDLRLFGAQGSAGQAVLIQGRPQCKCFG